MPESVACQISVTGQWFSPGDYLIATNKIRLQPLARVTESQVSKTLGDEHERKMG